MANRGQSTGVMRASCTVCSTERLERLAYLTLSPIVFGFTKSSFKELPFPSSHPLRARGRLDWLPFPRYAPCRYRSRNAELGSK